MWGFPNIRETTFPGGCRFCPFIGFPSVKGVFFAGDAIILSPMIFRFRLEAYNCCLVNTSTTFNPAVECPTWHAKFRCSSSTVFVIFTFYYMHLNVYSPHTFIFRFSNTPGFGHFRLEPIRFACTLKFTLLHFWYFYRYVGGWMVCGCVGG